MKITAVITGVGGGIGRTLCHSLSKVPCNTYGVSREPYTGEDSPTYKHIQLNLLEASGREVLSEILAKDNRDDDLRILIHNAGVLIKKPFREMEEKEIRMMAEVNFMLPFLLTHSLLPWLFSATKSHVVYLGSMGGFQGSVRYQGLSGYCVTKSAGSGLMESLAAEFDEKSVSFNTLSLGSVDTEMFHQAFPGQKGADPKDMADFIADFAVKGHRYFNGQVLPVTRGNPKLSI